MSKKKTHSNSEGPAPSRDSQLAAGGELHQIAGGEHPALTTNQGVALSDNQNSLRANSRGPTLLEDFILREKITHFDHERIPERIIHARGTGVHGFFELTASLKQYTTARVLTELGEKTPVFTRISTVAGGAGSVDTPRDVRGFAIKFYTKPLFADHHRRACYCRRRRRRLRECEAPGCSDFSKDPNPGEKSSGGCFRTCRLK
jgi:catalase